MAMRVEDTAIETGTSKRMDRIRGLSRLMAMACLVTSILLITAMLFYWIATPSQLLFNQTGVAMASAAELSLPMRLGGFAIAMVPLGALIYGLASARRCFMAFAAGIIFSSEPVNRLKAFALAIAWSALLKPVAGAALSIIISVYIGSGARTLALTVGSDTLVSLIFAGTVAVIAWILAEAIDIADENKQFV
jgi:hypothetical protein